MPKEPRNSITRVQWKLMLARSFEIWDRRNKKKGETKAQRRVVFKSLLPVSYKGWLFLSECAIPRRNPFIPDGAAAGERDEALQHFFAEQIDGFDLGRCDRYLRKPATDHVVADTGEILDGAYLILERDPRFPSTTKSMPFVALDAAFWPALDSCDEIWRDTETGGLVGTRVEEDRTVEAIVMPLAPWVQIVKKEPTLLITREEKP